jgi:hypothetical protein
LILWPQPQVCTLPLRNYLPHLEKALMLLFLRQPSKVESRTVIHKRGVLLLTGKKHTSLYESDPPFEVDVDRK